MCCGASGKAWERAPAVCLAPYIHIDPRSGLYRCAYTSKAFPTSRPTISSNTSITVHGPYQVSSDRHVLLAHLRLACRRRSERESAERRWPCWRPIWTSLWRHNCRCSSRRCPRSIRRGRATFWTTASLSGVTSGLPHHRYDGCGHWNSPLHHARLHGGALSRPNKASNCARV